MYDTSAVSTTTANMVGIEVSIPRTSLDMDSQCATVRAARSRRITCFRNPFQMRAAGASVSELTNHH